VGGQRNRSVLDAPAAVEPRATPSHDMSSYVPRLLANRLARSGPIRGYEVSGVRAALLLTDIAGFTAYVEQVSGSHPTGLEDLARDFDTYFADLVGLVWRDATPLRERAREVVRSRRPSRP
jgi:class 3 adenylate cyclase